MPSSSGSSATPSAPGACVRSIRTSTSWRNTPNVDFSHPFSENAVQRVRSVPGVARADNLIVWFMNIALPSGAQEGALVYALEDFTRWNLPWNVVEGNLEDLRRGPYMF